MLALIEKITQPLVATTKISAAPFIILAIIKSIISNILIHTKQKGLVKFRVNEKMMEALNPEKKYT
jgi:hypothetical protein